MIKRLFKASNSIASAAVVLGLAGLLSRLLGVYRDRLLATTFGAGATLDAYYAAFRIPDFVFNLLVLGALSAGFIPVFSEYLKKSKKEAWNLAHAVFYTLSVSLILICTVLFVFAPWIVPLLAPGFEGEVLKITITMTRIMLFSPILLGFSSVFGGVLQSFKHFLAYSLAPIFYNLGIIIGIFSFIKPWGVNGLAWGVVLGSFLHLTMQFMVTRKLGWRWQKVSLRGNSGLKEILHLMGPRTIALAIMQVNLLVITILASRLEAGRLAIFNLAQNLAHVPVGLFGVSFAIAAFPILSKLYAEKDKRGFTETLAKTLTQVVFFLFPTLVILALLDEQIVRLVLGAGEFDWQSTLLTAKTLLFLIPGIIGQALLPLFARAFYARKNTSYPLLAAFVGLVSNIVLALYFSKNYGVVGLAFAFSMAGLLQLVVLLISEYRHTETKARLSAVRPLFHILLASVFMLIVVQLVKEFTGPYLNLLTVKGVLVHFILPAFVGGVGYLLACRALGLEVYYSFEQLALRKIRAFSQAALPVEGTGGGEDDFFDN